MLNSKLLPISFFARSALVLAPDLIGAIIHRGKISIQITETEAYLPNDSACHGYRGKTARNAPLFGPPGTTYIYLCYGIHRLFNIVCGVEGEAEGVLIRGARVVCGLDEVKRIRPKLDLNGPGKVGQVLAVQVEQSAQILTPQNGLYLTKDTITSYSNGDVSSLGPVQRSPRIGIDYAQPKDRDALLRFFV